MDCQLEYNSIQCNIVYRDNLSSRKMQNTNSKVFPYKGLFMAMRVWWGDLAKPYYFKPLPLLCNPGGQFFICLQSLRFYISLHFPAFICISLHSSEFLCISLKLSAFLYISLHFSAFLYISLHFSAFLFISQHLLNDLENIAHVGIRSSL